MALGLKRNGAVLERSSVDGHLCTCPSSYKVVFPNNDGYTFEREYTLTESGGIWVGGGTVSFFMFLESFDIADIQNALIPPGQYDASISIEMTIDGGTGERSVRVVSDITLTPMGFPPTPLTGQSDYTEVFADGNTLNLSASSSTVRPVTLV